MALDLTLKFIEIMPIANSDEIIRAKYLHRTNNFDFIIFIASCSTSNI